MDKINFTIGLLVLNRILNVLKWLVMLVLGIITVSKNNDVIDGCFEVWIACLVWFILDTLLTLISTVTGKKDENNSFSKFCHLILFLGMFGTLIWISVIHANIDESCQDMYLLDYRGLWSYFIACLAVGWAFFILNIFVYGIAVGIIITNQ